MFIPSRRHSYRHPQHHPVAAVKTDQRQLLSPSLRDPAEVPVALPSNLREKEQPFPEFPDWMAGLSQYLPPDVDEALGEFQYCALMGVVVGLKDRDLSPFVADHAEIIPPLMEDIRSVYDQIMASGADFSHEDFIYRAFDYGIHKAYYLDWDRYMSHEMY